MGSQTFFLIIRCFLLLFFILPWVNSTSSFVFILTVLSIVIIFKKIKVKEIKEEKRNKKRRERKTFLLVNNENVSESYIAWILFLFLFLFLFFFFLEIICNYNGRKTQSRQIRGFVIKKWLSDYFSFLLSASFRKKDRLFTSTKNTF
jgi:hypothetical protein